MINNQQSNYSHKQQSFLPSDAARSQVSEEYDSADKSTAPTFKSSESSNAPIHQTDDPIGERAGEMHESDAGQESESHELLTEPDVENNATDAFEKQKALSNKSARSIKSKENQKPPILNKIENEIIELDFLADKVRLYKKVFKEKTKPRKVEIALVTCENRNEESVKNNIARLNEAQRQKLEIYLDNLAAFKEQNELIDIVSTITSSIDKAVPLLGKFPAEKFVARLRIAIETLQQHLPAQTDK